jgi:hypothetical protein
MDTWSARKIGRPDIHRNCSVLSETSLSFLGLVLGAWKKRLWFALCMAHRESLELVWLDVLSLDMMSETEVSPFLQLSTLIPYNEHNYLC